MTTHHPGHSEDCMVKGLVKLETACTTVREPSMLRQALLLKQEATTPQ